MRTCLPAGGQVEPREMVLTGTTFAFCLATASSDDRYCFTASLAANTIVSASAPPATGQSHKAEPGASIQPLVHGQNLSVCTADKATCHELPIDAASVETGLIAISDDATLVAIDKRRYRAGGTSQTLGKLETWDAVTGNRIASFEIHYGRDEDRFDPALRFVGHTVIAFASEPCSLPCSQATMYSVRGKYLGVLGAEASALDIEHFHDELYVLHSPTQQGFVVQDMATGTVLQPDTDTAASATIVTPDRIVRVVGSGTRPPRVEVWGPDVTLMTEIAVPTCRR